MSENEKPLLIAQARMCEQSLSSRGNPGVKSNETILDQMSMSAGEEAIRLLIEHGLVKPEAHEGAWTEAGPAFLESNR